MPCQLCESSRIQGYRFCVACGRPLAEADPLLLDIQGSDGSFASGTAAGADRSAAGDATQGGSLCESCGAPAGTGRTLCAECERVFGPVIAGQDSRGLVPAGTGRESQAESGQADAAPCGEGAARMDTMGAVPVGTSEPPVEAPALAAGGPVGRAPGDEPAPAGADQGTAGAAEPLPWWKEPRREPAGIAAAAMRPPEVETYAYNNWTPALPDGRTGDRPLAPRPPASPDAAEGSARSLGVRPPLAHEGPSAEALQGIRSSAPAPGVRPRPTPGAAAPPARRPMRPPNARVAARPPARPPAAPRPARAVTAAGAVLLVGLLAGAPLARHWMSGGSDPAPGTGAGPDDSTMHSGGQVAGDLQLALDGAADTAGAVVPSPAGRALALRDAASAPTRGPRPPGTAARRTSAARRSPPRPQTPNVAPEAPVEEASPPPLAAQAITAPPILPAPAAAPPSVATARPAPGPVFELAQVDRRPTIETQVPPVLPAPLHERVDEVLILKVLVSPAGRAADVALLRGSKIDPRVDAAAVAAVRQWTFAPAIRRGEPVSCWFSVGVPVRAGGPAGGSR
jgi:protein TonB